MADDIVKRLRRAEAEIVNRFRCADDATLDHGAKVALFLVVVDAIAEIARLRDERRWIPVGERLPQLDSEVLVAWSHEGDKEQVVSQAWRNHLGKFVNLEDTEFFGVTHWMPLPSPPTGGELN